MLARLMRVVSCPLLSHLPQLCEWYISGSPGRDGAASHLNEHCLKVWNALIANPADMLQRHNDGSFYTHAPTDIWEALHQHLSLALSTEYDIAIYDIPALPYYLDAWCCMSW